MNVEQLRGMLLEQFCRLLLEDSGFTLCTEEDPKVRYRGSDAIVEIRGKGTWHQIDLPYDYMYSIPFAYPIRVVGEVKYHQKQIPKSTMSTFIGVVKDIQENYFSPENEELPHFERRKLEQGLMISANGFQRESQKLAYAHNIKMVSFRGNPFLRPYLKAINRIAKESAQQKDRKDYGDLLGDCYSIIKDKYQRGNLYENPIDYVKRPENREREREMLSDASLRLFEKVNSYFVGTTSTGFLMFFFSGSPFPFDQFENRNDIEVQISYFTDRNDRVDPTISIHIGSTVFFSTLPPLIHEEFVSENQEHGNAIRTKMHHFSPITIYKKHPETGEMKIYTMHFYHNFV